MKKYLLTLVVAGLATMVAATAQAKMTEAEVRASIEQLYPVKVLRVTVTEVNGKGAFAVTVMNRGGDFNSAFQVTTLVVDADTGALIPVFGHRVSGYRLSAGHVRNDDRQPPDAARSGFIWR